MLIGLKHLITCKCILQQFKNLKNPPFHQFVVFSILNDDKMQLKFAQCNNCGIIHKITDVCTSEIVNKEYLSSLKLLDDIKCCIPEKLLSVLEKYNIEFPIWENIQFNIENELWGEPIILLNDKIDGVLQTKYLILLGKNLFKIDDQINEVSI